MLQFLPVLGFSIRLTLSYACPSKEPKEVCKLQSGYHFRNSWLILSAPLPSASSEMEQKLHFLALKGHMAQVHGRAGQELEEPARSRLAWGVTFLRWSLLASADQATLLHFPRAAFRGRRCRPARPPTLPTACTSHTQTITVTQSRLPPNATVRDEDDNTSACGKGYGAYIQSGE